MHPAVMEYVQFQAARHHDRINLGRVLEIGAQDVNGTVRAIFHDAASYVGNDIVAGHGVDVIGPIETVDLPADWFDVVVSTEVLEHHRHPYEVVRVAYRVLKRGGVVILTAAGPGRPPHGANGERRPQPGEWYHNIDPLGLEGWLRLAGFDDVEIDVLGSDVRATAVKGW